MCGRKNHATFGYRRISGVRSILAITLFFSFPVFVFKESDPPPAALATIFHMREFLIGKVLKNVYADTTKPVGVNMEYHHGICPGYACPHDRPIGLCPTHARVDLF